MSGRDRKELIKYPPQFKIGFMSNNPPVYDLLPKMQEILKENMEKWGGQTDAVEIAKKARAGSGASPSCPRL